MDRQTTHPEQVKQIRLPVARMPLQRIQDRRRRQPFVDEQRQRRHVEGQPLRLARPVQERLGERLQRAGIFAGRGERLPGVGEFAPGKLAGLNHGGEPLDPALQRGDFLLRPLARMVQPVPVERRRQRRVVAVGNRILFLAELRLRANIGPQQRTRLRAPFGAAHLADLARRLLPVRHPCARSFDNQTARESCGRQASPGRRMGQILSSSW